MGEGSKEMTQTMIRSASSAAIQRYYAAANNRAEAREEAIDIRHDLAGLRAKLEDIKSEVMVNGGTEAHPIDGKNAETRDAQLRMALTEDPHYQKSLDLIRDAERQLARLEAVIDASYDDMRGARLEIELATSENLRAYGEREPRDYRG